MNYGRCQYLKTLFEHVPIRYVVVGNKWLRWLRPPLAEAILSQNPVEFMELQILATLARRAKKNPNDGEE